jgi:hypothetical protein
MMEATMGGDSSAERHVEKGDKKKVSRKKRGNREFFN